MATKRSSRKLEWLIKLVGLWFASALVIASATPHSASAQSADDPWAVPLNLSHSGAATNPTIIIDSGSIARVIWQDEFEQYVYARFDGTLWSPPLSTDLHQLFGLSTSQPSPERSQMLLYTGLNPIFMAGPGPYTYAFWITPDGALYTSRVINNEFIDYTAWEEARLLSPSAAFFAADIDALGELHVAYLRTFDDSVNPAGIYYMRSKNYGLDWGLPELLYESPYFRRLRRGEANLSLATAGTTDAPQIYIAWDNRPRKQVLLARSADGGTSWERPVQIAGPTPESGLAGPFNIRVGATENSAVLVWQRSDQEGACTQFFQFSRDAGVTWSESQSMAKDLPGCAQLNEFVSDQATSAEDFLYLLTDIQGQIFLSAWNGSQWSEPQTQPILSGFEDPEIYTQVEYGCHRATLYGERLYIVGCDQDRGGDIWVTSLDLATTSSWFSPPVWNQPAPVTGDELDVAAIKMVATEDNLIHAVFSQRQDTAIYYTRWDGTTWSHITPVLTLPDGEAGWPAIASGPGNELFLIARSSRGSLYFSRAKSSEAVSASSWSTPTPLRIAHDGKVSPADVAWDNSGTIHIAYSVPLNDERGVYLVQSKDQGKTWSDPLQVFDGAAAKFDLVGSPSLLAAINGFIYITWTRDAMQAEGVSQPLSLYSVRSEDAGHTFRGSDLVLEAPVAWRGIAADGKGNLHRFWQMSDRMTALWDQISFDGGRVWQDAQLLPAEVGTATVTQDPFGRLHLVGSGVSSLSHWLWNGSRWQAEVPLRWSLASQSDGPVELLATAVNRDGKMVVVFAAPNGAGDTAGGLLQYTSRTLDQLPRQIATQETIVQSPPSPKYTPTSPPPERMFMPVATVASGSARLQGPIARVNNGGSMGTFVRALLPVALFLISVLGFVVLRVARVKDR